MSSSPELGIFCCQGNQEERDSALLLLGKQPRLIIDIISLLTLHGLGIADEVVKVFGQLGIAQSSIEILQNVVEEHKGMKSDGTAVLGIKGDRVFLHETTADEIKRNRKYFEGIITWVKNNCETLPCTMALDMQKAERHELEQLVGASFTDTLLIASETGNLLFSDDWALRQIAKAKFDLDGVWTQVILLYSQINHMLEQFRYSEIVVDLVLSNYRYTSIDDYSLIAAAKKADWLPKEPFLSLLSILENAPQKGIFILDDRRNTTYLASIKIAANFLYKLWNKNISQHRKKALGYRLLKSLTSNRYNQKLILNRLLLEVQQKYMIILPSKLEILSLISQFR